MTFKLNYEIEVGHKFTILEKLENQQKINWIKNGSWIKKIKKIKKNRKPEK